MLNSICDSKKKGDILFILYKCPLFVAKRNMLFHSSSESASSDDSIPDIYFLPQLYHPNNTILFYNRVSEHIQQSCQTLA